RARRTPSMASGGGAQGLRAVQGHVPCGARGHLRDQGHAAVCGGGAACRARADGRGLLVLRARPQPQGPGGLSTSSPCRGSLLAPACTRGAVSPFDSRKLYDLIFYLSMSFIAKPVPTPGSSPRAGFLRDMIYFSVPRSIAAVDTPG